MKKILFFLMAVMAMFTSCSSDEVVENASKDIKFDFTFDKEDENGTRALKSSWENGDKVYILFKNQYKGYLVCTYNGSTWTSSTVGTLNLTEAETNKQLIGFWIKGNPDPSTTAYSPETNTLKFVCLFWDGNPEWLSTDALTYTYKEATSTVTANLVFAMSKSDCIKITVTGLDKSKTWTLSSEKFCAGKQLTMSNMSIADLKAGFNGCDDWDKPVTGVTADDGIYFMGDGKGSIGDISFTLSDGTNTYTKTFTKKTFTSKKAYKFAGPTSADLNGWTKK